MATGSLVNRMIGAASLDVATYEEVEHDHQATGQAAVVVVIAAICSAIGGAKGSSSGMIGLLLGQLIGWLIWAGITYFIGEKLFGGTASWGELLRTLGFAQSPAVLYVLGIIPFFGGLVRFVVGFWILAAGIIAIRQALDFSTGKAILTALIGWLAIAIPLMLFGGLAYLGR